MTSLSTGNWTVSPQYQRGLDLLNRRIYFDAHELLEDVWREIKGHDRHFVQGLIQVAVAFHHHSRGNLAGALSLLKRAAANLAPYPSPFGNVQTDSLRAAISAWREALENCGPEPPPLEIRQVSSPLSLSRMLESAD